MKSKKPSRASTGKTRTPAGKSSSMRSMASKAKSSPGKSKSGTTKMSTAIANVRSSTRTFGPTPAKSLKPGTRPSIQGWRPTTPARVQPARPTRSRGPVTDSPLPGLMTMSGNDLDRAGQQNTLSGTDGATSASKAYPTPASLPLAESIHVLAAFNEALWDFDPTVNPELGDLVLTFAGAVVPPVGPFASVVLQSVNAPAKQVTFKPGASAPVTATFVDASTAQRFGSALGMASGFPPRTTVKAVPATNQWVIQFKMT